MTQFGILLFAHLLADYPLQGDFLAKMKGKYLLLMITHCGIWTGCVTLAAYFVGLSIGWVGIAMLFLIHGFADEVKAQGWYGNADPLGWPLWVDQAIHVGQLVGIWIIGRHP